MAVLTLNSIRLCTLALGATLTLAPPALAGDVSVKLDAATGFSVKNNTGATERLRVDEATGNISRNGALFVHTTGTSNLFVGPGAGNTSTAGVGGNSAFGRGALGSNTTGSLNTAVGYDALSSNTTGALNTAFGESALGYNSNGSYNSAVGSGALRYNTSGSNNAALGYRPLSQNTTGVGNSAVGSFALYSNTTASFNSAVGDNALSANTTGPSNAAVGAYALRFNTTGATNSAFGRDALRSNSVGAGNSAVGSYALRSNTTGVRNSAVGRYALRSNTTGQDNSAFGEGALYSNSAGRYNSAFGRGALFNTTGSRNLGVGAYAGINQTTGSDNIYLQNSGVATESNTIRIGSTATHTRLFLPTTLAAVSGTTLAINAVSGQVGPTVSSARFKEEIRDMGDTSAVVGKLRPVTFRYRKGAVAGDAAQVLQYGLIAEEVAEVAPELVAYDEQGRPYSVLYHELPALLLNEIKKQQHTIEAQRQQYEGEISALTTRLARVESRVGDVPVRAQR